MDPSNPNSKSDYYETPNLEALAAQGMRFSSAYAAPMCSPARAAIFTGRSPAQLNMTDVIAALQPAASQYQDFYTAKPSIPPLPMLMLNETVTVAERIKQYRPEYTTALFQKDHVGSNARHYGFDQYDFHMRGFEPAGEDPKRVFTAANQMNAFMEEQVQADNPFFLMLGAEATHAPIQYTTESFQKFANKPRGVNHNSAGHAAMTYDFDRSLGMMLDKIDQLGIADNTYVIFTSDNGGVNAPNNNAPLFGGKGSVWEGGVRVPMIVRGPGIQPGSVSDVPVSGLDIFATISDLLDINAPLGANIESASYVPVLHNGGELPAGASLSRAFGPNGELFFHHPHYSGISSPMSAVRDGDYKLVRVYGQSGAPDQIALFNIGANPLESSSTSSPLNLANQMPGKTAELLGKLDAWLVGVDAPMDRPVGLPVDLVWEASAPGTYPSLWRSVNQVDDLRRESWNIVPNHFLPTPPPNTTVAARVSEAAHQPGLTSHSFSFDGGDVMDTPFFRVSDPKLPNQFDSDHSASFEMWVKLANLTRNQVLFETGDAAQGLSLSVGDGNADGVHDELRFRVLSNNGQYLTGAADINKFADVIGDFVQITAVVSDDNADRYVELYVNGALATRVDGVSGDAGRLDWDGYDNAGLGGSAGVGVGGNGGGGLRPFDGKLLGRIARMRFQDAAISSEQALTNYNALLHPADFGVAGVQSGAFVPSFRPGNVSLGETESNSVLVVQERTDRLASPLAVDAKPAGGGVLSPTSSIPAGTLATGQDFSSYLLHFDPVGAAAGSTQVVSGSVQFQYNILGLLASDASLASTDAILGSIGNYGSALGRGLDFMAGDFVAVSADQRSLSFRLTLAGDLLAQLRILTAGPMPGDFNGDGQVSAADLTHWREGFGKNGSGDADHDGDTDNADFLTWQRRLGASPAFQATPEPSASVLALLGAWFLAVKSPGRLVGRSARR
jgi:arylsulfatase A-like enzyme